MLKSTIFSILAVAVPMASALEKAFKYAYTSDDHLYCYQMKLDTWIPDGECLDLLGFKLRPGQISSTCRGM